MEYAVVEFQGKQYKVEPGKPLTVDSLGLKDGERVELSKVLLYKKDDAVQIGSPYIKDFALTATIVASNRGKKIRVLRFRAKSKYHKVTGHRQELSTVRVDSFSPKQSQTSSNA